jgi:hypothetical protein
MKSLENLIKSLQASAPQSIEVQLVSVARENNWKEFLHLRLDDTEFKKRVKYDGITLFENEAWRLSLSIETPLHTARAVAITFPRESFIVALSDFEFEYTSFEINEDNCLTHKQQHRNKKSTFFSRENMAYELPYKEQEVIFLKLEEKSDMPPIASYFDVESGKRSGFFFINKYFERAKLFMSAIQPLKQHSIQTYIALTKHPLETIRWQAMLHLFKADHEEAKKILLHFLEDHSPLIRKQANATYKQLLEFEENSK